MATESDSPIQLPARRFTSDEKGHRMNNAAIEQFGNLTSYGTVPIGGIVGYAGTIAPPGWLECNGAAVGRRVYKELFSVIGTHYGVGDGSTTFNVPTEAQASNIFGGTNAASTNQGFMIIRTGAT